MKRLPLIALFAANGVSLTGSVLTIIAVPWFVLQTTGSASKTGLAAFAAAAAVVIASLFGGSLVDRLGHRRTSILGDLTSGTAVALVPTLYATVGIAFWQLLLLVFLANVFDAPGTTARTAMVPSVAGAAGVSLERASATVQIMQRGARLVGAPLAGVLIALLGPSELLWIDAATFGFSAALIAGAVRRPRAAAAAEAATRAAGGYVQDLKAGLGFIMRDPLTRAIVATVMITNFLDAPLFSVILPVFAKRIFDSALDLGLMIGAFGGGSLLGALVFAAVGQRLPRRLTFICSFVGMGVAFSVLMTVPSLAITIAVLLVGGLASGPVNPILFTVAYERIPEQMLGRVIGTAMAGAFLAIPLGVLVAGYLLQGPGVRFTLVALAVCYVSVTLGLLANPAIGQMDTPWPQSQSA